MQRRPALILSVGLVLLASTFQPVRAEWQFIREILDSNFAVQPGTYQLIRTERTGLVEKITINFTSSSANGSGDIDFLIYDQRRFRIWMLGFPVDAEVQVENSSEWSGEYQFPYDDSWYLIFSNRNGSNSTKLINVTIGLFRFIEQWPIVAPWITLVTVFYVFAVIIMVVMGLRIYKGDE